MADRAALGEFLRSRRSRLGPDDAGLSPDSRKRRVSGLRRDEVARLAGVSTEYYTRLEQGRSGNISAEVLGALAEALRLDDTEREHLAHLSGRPRCRRTSSPAQRVRPGVYQLLETLEHVPAFVVGRRTDILASNRLARAVITDFDAMPASRRNFALFLLLDPAARQLYPDWETLAAETAAILRLEAGRRPNDRQLGDLVGEVTLRCPEFSGWWNDHQVLRRTHGTKRHNHPEFGELVFAYEVLQIPGDPDQSLCVYNVEPGSRTEEAVRLLGSWTADARSSGTI
ncbi:MAG TPA: helix-turn-helix transcriptional regulator [Pseudonocardiaceae bacterium]|jgi:transcriptional regulator with XRE-family HTH domain